MSNKLSLHALTIAGIIAVSGLPAFAADMAPATPAPGAAVQSDSTKADAKIDPTKSKSVSTDKAKTVSKDASKDMKAATNKAQNGQASKDKVQPVQTAKLPASTSAAPGAPTTQVPAPTATVNGNVGTSVQH